MANLDDYGEWEHVSTIDFEGRDLQVVTKFSQDEPPSRGDRVPGGWLTQQIYDPETKLYHSSGLPFAPKPLR